MVCLVLKFRENRFDYQMESEKAGLSRRVTPLNNKERAANIVQSTVSHTLLLYDLESVSGEYKFIAGSDDSQYYIVLHNANFGNAKLSLRFISEA